jgi:ribulose bisphosphate carboxylase small subunit
MEFKNANDFRDTVWKSNGQDIGCRKDKASISELEVVKSCSHHCIQELNEE